jgi:lysophospholipase L1-like esterase
MAGQSITFVGSLSEGPSTVDGVPFPRQHEGHRGHTIEAGGGRMGVTPLIPPAVLAHEPHIVLLMIGTNDMTIELDLPNAPARLGALIDKITEAAPQALVVVAQIVPTMDDVQNRRVMTYNAAMPALVKERAEAGKHVVLVDMYGAFTARADFESSLMFDRVHPKDAGYEVMAGVWYEAIRRFLR